jgi:hypothetical protein
MSKTFLVVMMLLLAAAGSAMAADVYVDANLAGGANDGSSWSNAFQGPQGLMAAMPGTDNTIYVAQGVYKNSPPEVADATVSLQPGASCILMGGYNTSAAPPVRDPSMYQTIIDGDLLGDDEAIPDLFDNPGALFNVASRAENTNRLITIAGVANVTLDGFVLTQADASLGPPGVGAGIQIYGIANNTTIRNCRFTFISGGSGACINMIDQMQNVLIENCTFTQNCNGQGGGGTGGDAGGSCTLWYGAQTTFRNCVWTGNSALGDCAGIYVGHAHPNGTPTKATVYDCYMTRNTTAGEVGSFGGRQGVLSARGYDAATSANPNGVWAYNCVMSNNRCSPTNATPGGGGAVMIHGSDSDVSIRCVGYLVNCLIADNEIVTHADGSPATGTGGAGVAVRREAGASLVNCTVANNSGHFASIHVGCGVESDFPGMPGWVTVRNTIVWGNSGADCQFQPETAVTMGYSCIDDSDADPNNYHTGPGVITANPQMDGAYFIASASPCKNTGNNAYVTTTQDLSGRPRLNGTVDMGAYEFYRPGDVNGSVSVNLVDFELLAAAWLDGGCDVTNHWCGNTDTNHSGGVDMADFNNLAAEWLQ